MHRQPIQLIAALALGLAASFSVSAQQLAPEDMTLLNMQLGKSTLQEVIGQLGVTPLRQGDADEVCYRSENPLQAIWVLFGADDAGDFEKLTQFRVLTSEPGGISCRPLMAITPELATPSGIRIGMPVEELKPKIGPSLVVTEQDGRVTSFEVKLGK